MALRLGEAAACVAQAFKHAHVAQAFWPARTDDERTAERIPRVPREDERRILESGNLDIKRFFALDTRASEHGALPVQTKELMGLVASMVLRCDDCVTYHIVRCAEEGVRAHSSWRPSTWRWSSAGPSRFRTCDAPLRRSTRWRRPPVTLAGCPPRSISCRLDAAASPARLGPRDRRVPASHCARNSALRASSRSPRPRARRGARGRSRAGGRLVAGAARHPNFAQGPHRPCRHADDGRLGGDVARSGAADAMVTRRLKAAGAVSSARRTSTSSRSERRAIRARTGRHHPVDLSRSAGGSSGGAAVAVAMRWPSRPSAPTPAVRFGFPRQPAACGSEAGLR